MVDRQTARTRDFFDTAAEGWSSRYERDASMQERQQRFSDAVRAHLSGTAAILDFGCGSGEITRHLSNAGYRLTGCDMSEQMIGAARRTDADDRVQWLVVPEILPAAPLPFGNDIFDAIISSSVLEYVCDVDPTLNELVRLLRPGGWLFATVPDLRDPARRREQWLRWAATTPGLSALLQHSRWSEGARYLQISINRWSPEIWLRRLRHAGLEPGPLPDSAGPLLLIAARKPATA